MGCPFPLELEDSNVVELVDAKEGGVGDGRRGVPLDTQRAEEKILVRVKRQVSLSKDPQI